MQILRNKTTNEEFPITGSLGVPRETDENTFEVWTHFSVDLGDGQIDTIEVHPESTEWEVVDVPDPIPEPVPEPEPTPEPEPVQPSPEVLARNAWLENWHKYLKAKKAMEALRDADITPSVEEETAFTALKQWVADNRRIEYVEFM